MHVVAQHRILDRERFASMDPKDVALGGPPGVRALSFLPSRDLTAAICLWEAPSVEAVRDYLDPVTAGVAENSYFAVEDAAAISVPPPAEPQQTGQVHVPRPAVPACRSIVVMSEPAAAA
jgi:hypothetical protein